MSCFGAEEKETQERIAYFQEKLEQEQSVEETRNQEISEIALEAAGIRQRLSFNEENADRILGELQKLEEEAGGLHKESADSEKEVEQRKETIVSIRETVDTARQTARDLEEKVKAGQEKRETMSAQYKGFFKQREELSGHINELDKEIFRLNAQKEKLEASEESQTAYMWEEYELTLHHAMEIAPPTELSTPELKKQIARVKEEIKGLGHVNIDAIEEYKNVSERYEFMNAQRNDLQEAEATLLQIIQDLDAGMRKQFQEKFGQIQEEFNKAFRDLFGGGKGTLELAEGEDILECGINIIAHPPGKKLQNMMQLSGGEKALTAIALLFAIQNLKPSPFCLLDEIEAALDDSNVDRFARYLNKLTKHTQFIMITHRRGTMAAADRLYGITMQEKGVSALVSVNLIEADLDE